MSEELRSEFHQQLDESGAQLPCASCSWQRSTSLSPAGPQASTRREASRQGRDKETARVLGCLQSKGRRRTRGKMVRRA